jgi:hypothetical protein
MLHTHTTWKAAVDKRKVHLVLGEFSGSITDGVRRYKEIF